MNVESHTNLILIQRGEQVREWEGDRWDDIIHEIVPRARKYYVEISPHAVRQLFSVILSNFLSCWQSKHFHSIIEISTYLRDGKKHGQVEREKNDESFAKRITKRILSIQERFRPSHWQRSPKGIKFNFVPARKSFFYAPITATKQFLPARVMK